MSWVYIPACDAQSCPWYIMHTYHRCLFLPTSHIPHYQQILHVSVIFLIACSKCYGALASLTDICAHCTILLSFYILLLYLVMFAYLDCTVQQSPSWAQCFNICVLSSSFDMLHYTFVLKLYSSWPSDWTVNRKKLSPLLLCTSSTLPPFSLLQGFLWLCKPSIWIHRKQRFIEIHIGAVNPENGLLLFGIKLGLEFKTQINLKPRQFLYYRDLCL